MPHQHRYPSGRDVEPERQPGAWGWLIWGLTRIGDMWLGALGGEVPSLPSQGTGMAGRATRYEDPRD